MYSSAIDLEKYRIPLEEIIRATENFSSKTQIGDGGFGMVYKGHWQNRIVAIKRLNRNGYQGNNKEFHDELKMISSFLHPNIIPFMGYCDEADEMIVVYEYAIHGSLDSHLKDPNKRRCITWAQRLTICLGAAKGLKYLHSALGKDTTMIHRDVNSANIFLDEILQAKICDFGFSRFGPRNQKDIQLDTKFYMDPNERDEGSMESDIYSFGVMLFEMSSGMLAYRAKRFVDGKEQFLMELVKSYYDDHEQGVLKKLIDPVIKDRIDMSSLHKFNKIARQCVNLDSKKRPTMDRIIDQIEEALNIQLEHICCKAFTDTVNNNDRFQPEDVENILYGELDRWEHTCCKAFTYTPQVNNIDDAIPIRSQIIPTFPKSDRVNNIDDRFSPADDENIPYAKLDRPQVNNIDDAIPIRSQTILTFPKSDRIDDRNDDLPPSSTNKNFKNPKTYKVRLKRLVQKLIKLIRSRD